MLFNILQIILQKTLQKTNYIVSFLFLKQHFPSFSVIFPRVLAHIDLKMLFSRRSITC